MNLSSRVIDQEAHFKISDLSGGSMLPGCLRVAKESIFTDYMKKTISIRDTFVKKPTKENFYHGLLLGILGFKEN